MLDINYVFSAYCSWIWHPRNQVLSEWCQSSPCGQTQDTGCQGDWCAFQCRWRWAYETNSCLVLLRYDIGMVIISDTLIVVFILPGLSESKLLTSKQLGDQWLFPKGLHNEDKVPCPNSTTAAASRFEPATSYLRVCGLIHCAMTVPHVMLRALLFMTKIPH